VKGVSEKAREGKKGKKRAKVREQKADVECSLTKDTVEKEKIERESREKGTLTCRRGRAPGKGR
jgi:hypothetical protein